MDLVSTIRKEGSRGGVDFKWSDVATSTHRENYLGHSLMAPVGRWQKNRDLTWYAKSGEDSSSHPNETEAERAARERREEIRRVKEAEEDALARALGLPVTPRQATGANSIDVKEVNRVVKEVGEDSQFDDEIRKGLGDSAGAPGDEETIEQQSGRDDNEKIEAVAEGERETASVAANAVEVGVASTDTDDIGNGLAAARDDHTEMEETSNEAATEVEAGTEENAVIEVRVEIADDTAVTAENGTRRGIGGVKSEAGHHEIKTDGGGRDVEQRTVLLNCLSLALHNGQITKTVSTPT